MNLLGVLQARMTSTRFPGKVLEPILEKPMIVRQINRLQRSKLMTNLIVATSIDKSDDLLTSILESEGIAVYRGDLEDVLGRFIGVLNSLNPDVVVRLTADCPLTSPMVIDRVISEFLASQVDYASNTLVPTFPDGLDVEVVTADALRWVDSNTSDPIEREHVTLGVYRRPEIFKLLSVQDEVPRGHLRWTVDVEPDLEFVRWVYAKLLGDEQAFDYADVLELLSANPHLSRTDAEFRRNAAIRGLDTGVLKLEM
jgi:spore coat polysaccharide biosynthesis protein SpsF